MQDIKSFRHRIRRRNHLVVVNVVEFLHRRSIGSKGEFDRVRWPSVPIYAIADIEDHADRLQDSAVLSSDNIRKYAILGIIPNDSRMILTMTASAPATSMEEMERDTLVPQSGSSLAVWCFQPSRTLGMVLTRTTPVHMQVDSKNLWRAYTAFTKQTRMIAQVLVYWNGVDTSGGHITVRYLNLDFSLERRAMCITDEVSTATTCFAKRDYYVPILLQTRCLFLMNHKAEKTTSMSMPAYWTNDSEWSFVSPTEGTMVRAFEFDLFVESLMEKATSTASIDSDGAKVKYYRPYFSTRDTTDLVRAYEAKRRVKLRLDHGVVFTLAVLTADLASLLVLTLLVDPTSRTTGLVDESVRVLEAKRWKLGHASDDAERTNIGKRLDRAVQKIYPTQHTGSHDCRVESTCKGNDILATYDPHRSVNLIEGEYWHISGDGWKNE